MNGSYEYLMSDRYCKEWTIPMAIRELIANAHDAAKAAAKPIQDEVTLGWNSGVASIHNQSIELQKTNLLFGESDKSDSQVGQFGEGMKVAALVLVRNGGNFIITSGNTIYSFQMKNSEDFNVPLLTVTLAPSAVATSPGTTVAFDCSEADFLEAKSLFAEYSAPKQITEKILANSGDVYVLGVKVTHVEKALFGYSLTKKTLMNRDRTVVDQASLKESVRSVWANCEDSKAIEGLLLAAAGDRNSYEGNITCYSTMISWPHIVKELYGDKVCLRHSSDQANERARYLGYAVLDFGDGINDTLSYGGLIRANMVSPEEAKALSRKELTVEQRNCLDAARYHAKALLGLQKGDRLYRPADQVKAANLPEDTLEQVKSSSNEIWVNVTALRVGNQAPVAASIVHALAHLDSYAGDCSAQFEAGLTSMIEKAIARKIRKPDAKY